VVTNTGLNHMFHYTLKISNMKHKYTIDEIKNYILKQDSLGDVLYNLNHDKIMEANEPEDDDDEEE
jgi:hypothetical protein